MTQIASLDKIKVQLIRMSIAHPEAFGDLMSKCRTNPRERKIIALTNMTGKIDSHGYSVAEGLSIQHASTQLVNMYKKGLLRRVQRTSTSGGIEFDYFLSDVVQQAIEVKR